MAKSSQRIKAEEIILGKNNDVQLRRNGGIVTIYVPLEDTKILQEIISIMGENNAKNARDAYDTVERFSDQDAAQHTDVLSTNISNPFYGVHRSNNTVGISIREVHFNEIAGKIQGSGKQQNV